MPALSSFKNPLLQPFAPGVTPVQIVPELDVLLVLFPAEEDLLPTPNRGKIDQAAVEVFDLDFPRLKLLDHLVESGQGAEPAVGRFAAQVIPLGQPRGGPGFGLLELLAQSQHFLEPFPNPRKERAGLLPAVMPPEPKGHGSALRRAVAVRLVELAPDRFAGLQGERFAPGLTRLVVPFQLRVDVTQMIVQDGVGFGGMFHRP
jgi:hypothetical protein